MFSRLFSPRRPAIERLDASAPPGQRIYAIGDIHGRFDLLEELLAKIEADNGARDSSETQLIFLGDLIDRGPESAQVVERLRALRESNDLASSRFLLGNHEEVFLAVLAGNLKALRMFSKIGGRETILSYGISREEYERLDDPDLLELLLQRVPQSHIDFLRSFEDLIVAGDYAFVHAGIRPAEPLARQKASDLRWIRSEFIDFKGELEKVVVHGHTIADEVEVLSHRIGLDTGAFASGRLSAMGFEAGQRWTIQTAGA